MSGKTGRERDPAWKYCDPVKGPGNCRYVRCKFCNKVITAGISRLKEHLAGTHRDTKPCEHVPEEARSTMKALLNKTEQSKKAREKEFNELVDGGSYFNIPTLSGKGSSSKGNVSSRGVRGPMDRFVNDLTQEDEDKDRKLSEKEARRLTCLDIGRFFIENGVPANVASSPSFVNMLRSVGNFGRGLKPPTPYEISSWILKEEVSTTDSIVADVKKTWTQTGVSILSDGWKDIRGRSLVNFLVNNPHGTIFLKCVDVSDAIKDANLIFKLLDEVVEEVGENIVVQVVTDNASNYKLAGKKLMEKRPHLWWTPCAAHCIDLMLEKIGSLPQHKNALLKAKKVSSFIYNHGWVLALMRKHTGKLRPATTRFATAYLTLQSMFDSRQPLEAMFTSSDWSQSSYSKKSDGKAIKKIIFDRSFWLSVAYAIKTTRPLVQVLRMTDSEKMPGMGFLYGAMDKAKEEIAKNLGGEEGSYKELWSIIDEKWEFQMHRPLHAAAYFLNPHFQYDEGFSTHYEVKRGLIECMEKLIPNVKDREKADIQLDIFRNRRGLFGGEIARLSCKKRSPTDWWIQYGDETPELTSFAVRILSLTCSSSACERNWSTFSLIHTKRRNKLTTKNLNTLAYVMYNKKLKDRHLKRKSFTEEQDPLIVSEQPQLDDEYVDEWVDEGVGFDHQDHVDVRGVAQGSGNRQQTRKRKKPSQAKDKNKQLQLIDETENEWEEESNEDDEDDRAIRYADDSNEDPLSEESGDEDGDEEEGHAEYFAPLDTNDPLLQFTDD